MRQIYITAISLLIATFLGSPSAVAANLEGVVFSNSGPVPNSVIYAYPDYSSLVNEENGIKSSPGEKEGQYKIDLPAGTYYLIAKGQLGEHHLFSYHGVNPITIHKDYQWLPFFLVEESRTVCSSDKGQGLGGIVTYRGHPLDHGVVSIYQRQDGKFRGMGLLTNTIYEDGRFRFNLEPGTYVVIARKKKAERGIGPVLQGDLFCYPSANPISIAEDQFCELEIPCYPRDDLETYLEDNALNPQGRRLEARRGASLWDITPSTAQMVSSEKPAIIEGKVQDLAGRPVPALIVTAYPAMGVDPFQMHVLRLITDNMAQTDAEGKYRIELPGGGTYYLQARQKIGEAPNRQEYYGLYEGNHNHAITINGGETRSGVDIMVEPIMPFSELQHGFKEK